MKIENQRNEPRNLYCFLEQVENIFEVYAPPFQRKVIQHIINGSRPRRDISGSMDYVIENLEKLFDGCNVSFRNNVLSIYSEKTLPSLEVEHNKTVEIQDATDELLALTEGKTAQEIKAMIEALRANKVLVST